MNKQELEAIIEQEKKSNEHLALILQELMRKIEEATRRSSQLEGQIIETRSIIDSLVHSTTPLTSFSSSPQLLSPPPSSSIDIPEDRTRPTVRISSEEGKVFHGKMFNVNVFVPLSWRVSRGLNQEQIIKMVCLAQVCREDNLEQITNCPNCEQQPIIAITFNRETIGPILVEQPQQLLNTKTETLERYSFDNCQSKCSSSRDHFHTRVVLKVQFSTNDDPIYSQPFALMSRENPATKHNNNATIESSPQQKIQQQPIIVEEQVIKQALLVACVNLPVGKQHVSFEQLAKTLSENVSGYLESQVASNLPGKAFILISCENEQSAQQAHQKLLDHFQQQSVNQTQGTLEFIMTL